jgi:hypothetical protein
MRIDDISNSQIAFFRDPQIEFDVVNGVAHGALGFPASAEEIGSGDSGMTVQQLSKNHL